MTRMAGVRRKERKGEGEEDNMYVSDGLFFIYIYWENWYNS